MPNANITVRDLRRRWKPHKERLQKTAPHSATPIRFHRACSWMQRVEQAGEETDVDFALLGRWIAFNALYGRWNESEREPLPDVTCWKDFLRRILRLDQGNRMGSLLVEHKRLVMAIFEDRYLSKFFWEEPGDARARKVLKVKFDARTWYIKKQWGLILEKLVERIYLLRCQLVHGAATHNSKLNRTSLRRCATMLEHLLVSILLVWIDHGADEDWGPMCYPPLQQTQATSLNARRT